VVVKYVKTGMTEKYDSIAYGFVQKNKGQKMTKRTGRKHSAELKAKVTVAANVGDKTFLKSFC
jgi:hypothetical protein